MTRDEFDKLAGITSSDSPADRRAKRSFAAHKMRHGWKAAVPGRIAAPLDAAVAGLPRLSDALMDLNDALSRLVPEHMRNRVAIDAYRRGIVLIAVTDASTRFVLTRDGFANKLRSLLSGRVHVSGVRFAIKGVMRERQRGNEFAGQMPAGELPVPVVSKPAKPPCLPEMPPPAGARVPRLRELLEEDAGMEKRMPRVREEGCSSATARPCAGDT